MKELDNWKDATEQLARAFVKECFPESVYGDDAWWVCDIVGGVLFVGDYYFSIDRIVEFFELGATPDQLLEYYDYEFEHAVSEDGDMPPKVNFINFVKHGMK